MKHRKFVLAAGLAVCVSVSGCQDPIGAALPTTGKAHIELPVKLQNQMKQLNMAKNSAIMVRIFKEENTLEVWKQRRDGRYALISSYEICTWSGKLGPKFIEGDRQAPEGFYTVRPAQMNPNSQYYLAFNIGYPNEYDRVNGRTGKHLMVHGACSSAGCYSMSDENIAEIYAFARDAFKGGQQAFQIQAFPFRMTAANMARYTQDPNYPFWQMLKRGYDLFEMTHQPPRVDVCEKKYVFNQTGVGDAPLNPVAACPVREGEVNLASFLKDEKEGGVSAFGVLGKLRKSPPSASIQGVEEARLVADWSRRRAKGEKVSREPPSLEAKSSAADLTLPLEPMQQPQMVQPGQSVDVTDEASSPSDDPIIQKKRGWSLFRAK